MPRLTTSAVAMIRAASIDTKSGALMSVSYVSGIMVADMPPCRAVTIP